MRSLFTPFFGLGHPESDVWWVWCCMLDRFLNPIQRAGCTVRPPCSLMVTGWKVFPEGRVNDTHNAGLEKQGGGSFSSAALAWLSRSRCEYRHFRSCHLCPDPRRCPSTNHINLSPVLLGSWVVQQQNVLPQCPGKAQRCDWQERWYRQESEKSRKSIQQVPLSHS